MKKNHHITAEIRPFREPGNAGGWKNRFSGMSSPEKYSARALNRPGTLDKCVPGSSSDAIIRLLQDCLAASHRVLPASQAASANNVAPAKNSLPDEVAFKTAMEAELNELRYYLDQNVERRTEQLVKRMALLESCNATLCDKLASAQRELAALKQQQVCNLPEAEQNDCTGRLYAMGDWARNLIGTSVQDDWVGHATAA